jgi:cytochrome c-type biogenesis protein CcsB
MRGETQAYVMKIIATSTHKQEAAQQVDSAASWMLGSMESPNRPGGMQSLQIIPPPDGHPTPTIWLTPINIAGNVPELVAAMQRDLGRAPPPVNGVSNELASRFVNDLSALRTAWIRGDAADANKHIAAVADALPKFTPSKYPSALKRNAEVVYNRMTRLALPGVAFYFTAFVLFIMAARSGGAGLRKWGFRFLLGGFAIHVTAIGIRWWLVEKATDDWFHAIPIKNQYESVLWSVFLGIAAALVIMALLRSHVAKSIIGVGAGFLGWLGLLAIWITPYVTGREIGAEIGQVNGVLMSYWLYIHVTTVVFSYGLITIGFALSVWWLWRYYGEYGTVSKLANQRQLSADAVKEPQFNLGIATPALATGTVAKMQFAPNAKGGAAAAVAAPAGDNAMQSASDPKGFLATLDLCNLVVLQLAFWVLGAGIIFGAIWADMSWGRPWGWDPKETFALVTWIVYLVVVHVRVVTPHKAWWTAVLSIAGFFIMLFNWIGVNFFLVGLHSYA